MLLQQFWHVSWPGYHPQYHGHAGRESHTGVAVGVGVGVGVLVGVMVAVGVGVLVAVAVRVGVAVGVGVNVIVGVVAMVGVSVIIESSSKRAYTALSLFISTEVHACPPQIQSIKNDPSLGVPGARLTKVLRS